ncbi:MAG: hypothetical protein Q9222_001152 [Ikaeria aurantiellina]
MSSIGSSGPNSWHALLIQAAGKGDEAKVRDLLGEALPSETTFKDALRIATQRAVSRGHEPLTRLLLEQGAPLNLAVEGEVPTLHRAAELGRDSIVKLLLQFGADVNSKDKSQRTAIFPAAQRGHRNTLSLLLEAGADANVKDEDAQTVILCLAAVKSEKLTKWGSEIVEMLLRTNVDLEVRDKGGRTALLWAASSGKGTLAKLLLTSRVHNKADITASNHRGKTALHLAVESKVNRLALIKLLLENGADVHAKSDGGWTPLHNAAEKGFSDVASILLEWKAAVNATTSSGMTALHWCARNGHVDMVNLLLRHQNVRIHRKDAFEETPMLGAAQNGHIEIARLLSPTNDWEKLSHAARAACTGFEATVIDFGMEHRPMNLKKHSVFDVLYGWEEDRQRPAVTTLARNVPAKPAFRWIHLPTNNVTWVETLLTKHFIENSASDVDGFKALEKILGQQHRGSTVHSFFMRPLCQRMPPTGKDVPSSATPDVLHEESNMDHTPTTAIIVLPEQENATPPNQQHQLHNPNKKSVQSERRSKAAKKPPTDKASKIKAPHDSAISSPPQRKRGDRQSFQIKKPTDKHLERKGNIVLFMPYLHYETHENRKMMSEAIKRAKATTSGFSESHGHYTCDEMLIQAYLESTHNLHIRRTLDQFYYHAISTEERDADQVVYRYTRDKGKKRKVFMVDQLWLWILGKDLIITSFPQRWEQPKNDPLNVLDGIIEDMSSKTRPPVRSVHDLATLITSRCSGVFDRHRLGDEDYQFLDMFESSIGQVTNKETELFMKFNNASKDAKQWLANQREKGKSILVEAPARDRDSLVDTLLDIGEETALLAETKDIRDELNMISMVLKHQISILDDMMHALLDEAKGPHNQQAQAEIRKRYREQHKVVEVHLKDVERMDRQAEGIYTSLTHLLDLKQKHANAFEARFARDQAAFTGRQGQTIMVFTLVTIVFLPMSFIAAVFAIPVRDFPHEDGTPSIPFSYVSKIMFGVGLGISIPLIALAFAVDNLGVLIKDTIQSLMFWKPRPPGITTPEVEPKQLASDDEEAKPTILGRRSGDSYRRKYRKLPVLVNESTCSGKTYIITGSNSGLGLETARHLVACLASCVVLAVRNMAAGETAKRDIEKTTGREGIIQIMHLDMASSASVRGFAEKASKEFDRIDGLVANAGIMIDAWSTTEEMETSVTVNVINTLFLGVLLMPKLSECGRRFYIHPTIVFIVSVLGYTIKDEMDKSREGGVFEGLNDQKRANMDKRYALTKLVEELVVRQFAALNPVQDTNVVVNMVAPGLCSTGLGRDVRTFTKIAHETIRAVMARTPEVGSRTILHGLVAGEESHGKLLSGCKIKEYWVPEWINNAEGLKLQNDTWTELASRLEEVQPGCISQLSQL